MHPDTATPVLSVAALNRLVQQTLQGAIPLTWIAGEISNLTRAASGHWYFSLKDRSAQVRCVMFRSRNQFIDWQPDNGMQVEVRATAGLYEPRGEFQLQVDTLRRAGLGVLFEAYEQLKRKLAEEGLFAADRKRPIPALPRRIGIITSPQAAALQDVLSTLRRQMPGLPIVLYPCGVQGSAAAGQIVAALYAAYQRAECDVLIVCRGGGSIEDLWPFNEEIVVRALAASPIPTICGIGHETDFTIADFVADLRASTPTAAAVAATPDAAVWRAALRDLAGRAGALEAARGVSQCVALCLDRFGHRQVEATSQVEQAGAPDSHIRRHGHSGGCRRRGTHIGDEICDGEVCLVTDAGNDWRA